MIVNKKTKIVATLGPSTESKKIKTKMVKNGVNVFRINFSHATYDEVKEQIIQIREISKELKIPVGILADLQGPKLRIGKVEKGTYLQEGEEFIFTTKDKIVTNNENKKAYITYNRLPCDVNRGEIILVDDGKIQLKVKSTDKKSIVVTEVIEGGVISSKKGVNLPNTKISLPALTKKDKKDLLFAIEMKVDLVALSFVRGADDIKIINNFIKEHSKYKIPVIAKIEKPEAVRNINEIINFADGLMVARGDLGIEVPLQKVPLIQKRMVYLAKKHQKPIIIATQMMESMIEGSIPTRAEVNDVANSVMDGADAVMLSGETSIGKKPVRVIKQITKIIKEVENSNLIKIADTLSIPEKRDARFISEVICYDAYELAKNVSASVITTFTASGFSAYKISARRPMSYILVFTAHKRLLNSLTLVWGVIPYYYDKLTSTDDTIKDIEKIAKENGFVEKNDMIVSVFSMPIDKKGMVNTLRIIQVN